MNADDGGEGGEVPADLSPGERAVARAKAIDDERIARADPIYPDEDRAVNEVEAAELASAFRALRDSRRGELVAPRSALPGDPEHVATALLAEAEARMEGLDGRGLKAAQRELAEVFVDLQAFRPDDEAVKIQSDPTGAVAELEALRTAQAAIIQLIREDDMSVTGNMNAMRGLDLRIGDGRIALDAVNRYRERQALGLLAIGGIAVLVVVVLAVIVVLLVIRPSL